MPGFCCLILVFIWELWKVGPGQFFCVYRGIYMCIFCLLGSLLVSVATSERGVQITQDSVSQGSAFAVWQRLCFKG